MNLIPADLVHWEATYSNGYVDRESMGSKYRNIDRNQLRSFRLVAPGETLIELPISDGRTGWNFFYRRRTQMSPGGRNVIFLMGFVPMGPIVIIDPQSGTIQQSDRFIPGHALFSVPQAMEAEGEHFDFGAKAHQTDVRLKPNQITLPSGYVMKVP